MLTTLLTVATASVVGSLHCAAMCGGLVSFTCATSNNPRLAQLSYHAGRLVVYAGLGAVAGYLGQSLNQHFDVSGYQNVAGLLAGSAMIGWAVLSLYRRWRARSAITQTKSPERLVVVARSKPPETRASAWLRRIYTLPSAVRGALLGLTSAILPCGWLYAFVTVSAGHGSPATGALVMSAFWLGTLPMLLGLGGLVSVFGTRLQRYLPHVSTVVLLALGLGTIAFRQPLHSGILSTEDAPSHHSCH